MDWKYNTIWTDQLPEGSYQEAIFKGKVKYWEVPLNASYYYIWGYNPKSNSLRELNGIKNALSLKFVRSNIHSLDGLSEFGKLKRVELDYCLKLHCDAGLSDLSESLEWLHIKTSKKFIPSKNLLSIKNLKVLCLNACGPLESLDFLENFPDLVDFRFVNTNVIDGNLRPILEHPNIVNVGMLDKRHFNLTRDEIKSHLEEKNENSKIYTYKGDYRTYMHSVFNNA